MVCWLPKIVTVIGLSKAIRKLLVDTKLRAQMAEEAKSFMSNYSLEQTVDQWEKLIKTIKQSVD